MKKFIFAASLSFALAQVLTACGFTAQRDDVSSNFAKVAPPPKLTTGGVASATNVSGTSTTTTGTGSTGTSAASQNSNPSSNACQTGDESSLSSSELLQVGDQDIKVKVIASTVAGQSSQADVTGTYSFKGVAYEFKHSQSDTQNPRNASSDLNAQSYTLDGGYQVDIYDQCYDEKCEYYMMLFTLYPNQGTCSVRPSQLGILYINGKMASKSMVYHSQADFLVKSMSQVESELLKMNDIIAE